jgi:ABC-type phosphate transport system permease subunit
MINREHLCLISPPALFGNRALRISLQRRRNIFALAETIRSHARISRGRRSSMLENLFSTAVALFVGYILIEGVARWMLDRRHSRSRPKDQGD